ncbi:MAG: hypothetical protein ACTSX9_04120 [Candidatus Njordarchaeales archaeon]
MMLVQELCKIPGSRYIPKFEKCVTYIITKDRKKEIGIWDILGCYDSSQEIIFICEDNIADEVNKLLGNTTFSRELFKKLGLDTPSETSKEGLVRGYLTLILRELVRLHEHAHAYTSTAMIEVSEPTIDLDWNKCRDVNEPLAEFIVRYILEYIKEKRSQSIGELFILVFDKVDNHAPYWYLNWKKLWKEIRPKIAEKLLRPSKTIIPSLVKFARSKKWSNWDEFYQGFKNKIDSICADAFALSCPSEN